MDVSVIMPALNSEDFIADAIESVVNQKGVSFELIIINDGSTDKTEQIVRKYMNTFNNIVLINQTNHGLSYSRKVGLNKSKGKYIYFCDSDDILMPNALKFMKDTYEKHSLDCLIVNARFKNELDVEFGIKNDNKKVISKNIPTFILTGEDMLQSMIQMREWRYAVWLYFTTKEKIMESHIDFFKYLIHEDAPYNYQLLNSCKKVKFEDEVVYLYRLRKNSLMSSSSLNDDIRGYSNALEKIYQYNEENYKNISNKYIFEIRMIDQIVELIKGITDFQQFKGNDYMNKILEILSIRNYYDNQEYKSIFNNFENKRQIKEDHIEYLEIHLADSCNLNCKGCCHFAPLANEKYPNIDEFEKDIQRLSTLINKKLNRLVFLGGEPLLNKDIIKYFEISRLFFPDTEIQVLTNGILLPNMDEKFWASCQRLDIQINITKYPIKINYDLIIEKIKSKSIKYFIYSEDNKTNKTFDKYKFDYKGKQNASENFYKKCIMAKDYAYMINGKIYPCQLANNIIIYNQYFNESLIQSKNDYIDIYEVQDENEIYEFLTKPIPFCKYCDFREREKFKWDLSLREKKEWSK